MLGRELSSVFSKATGSDPSSDLAAADLPCPRGHVLLALAVLVASALLVGCGRSTKVDTTSTLTRQQLEENATKGDAQAQTLLGKIYLEGPRSDQTQAVGYFEAAAGQGVVEAQYYPAMMADDGRGLHRK